MDTASTQTHLTAIPGKHVNVHVPDSPHAVRVARGEQRQAEMAVAATAKLLDVALTNVHIEVYFTDCSPLALDNPSAILRPLSTDAAAEPIARSAAREVIRILCGDNALQANGIAEGLIGIICSRLGVGPSIAECNAQLRERVARGDRVTALTSYQASTSFADYLLRTIKPSDIKLFLESYDPARPDYAAVHTLHRPMAVLEEAWLAQLQQAAKSAGVRRFLAHVVPLYTPYRWRLLLIIAYMFVGAGLSLVAPKATNWLMDTIIPTQNLVLLVPFVAMVLTAAVLEFAINLLRTYASTRVQQNVLLTLQQRMFEKLLALPHSYHTRAKVGDLMMRFTNDIMQVQGALQQITVNGTYQFLLACTFAVTMLIAQWQLGLLVLAIVGVFSFFYPKLRQRVQEASREEQGRGGEASSLLQESLSAHGLIKAYGVHKQAVGAFMSRLSQQYAAGRKVIVSATLFGGMFTLATAMATAAVLTLGGLMAVQGIISPGALTMYLLLVGRLVGAVTSLSGVGQSVQQASGSMERIAAILDEPIAIKNKPDAPPLAPLQQQIAFNNVTFSYDSGRTTLDDVTFAVPAGSYVVIVGPTGSGKSTIVNLLLRFFDPDSGSLTFDGVDIRDTTLESLRSQIGLVFQDTFVFNTTLRENIAMGRPESTEEEINRAIRDANLESYVASLPSGLDTILGERGVTMSGGQRQRLAIARALLRNPRVLILDEATSALDPKTEAEILDTLASLQAGRTTIAITHRLAMAARADRIYVLENGRLVQEGTEQELLAADGLYKHLRDEQTSAPKQKILPPVEPSVLRNVTLFAELDASALPAIAENMTVERCQQGKVIMREGDEGDKLYIIESGSVEVVRNGELLAELHEGDFFGELALITGEPRSATITATSDTILYCLSKHHFESILDANREVMNALRPILAKRSGPLGMPQGKGPPPGARGPF